MRAMVGDYRSRGLPEASLTRAARFGPESARRLPPSGATSMDPPSSRHSDRSPLRRRALVNEAPRGRFSGSPTSGRAGTKEDGTP